MKRFHVSATFGSAAETWNTVIEAPDARRAHKIGRDRIGLPPYVKTTVTPTTCPPLAPYKSGETLAGIIAKCPDPAARERMTAAMERLKEIK